METKIKFEQKRNIGSMLEATFLFYKQEFKSLAGNLLTLMMPPILISAILLKDLNADLTSGNFAMLFLSYAIILAVTFFNYVITYEYIILYLNNEKITAQILMRAALKNTFKYMGIYILSVLVIFISAFFFLIPAIYFAVIMFPIMFVARYEDKGFADSFNRCNFLIRNNWWNTFLLIFIVYISFIILSLVFSLPAQIEAFSMLLQESSDPSGFIDASRNVFYLILSQVGSVILTPLFIISAAVQYFNLVERKEKKSLMDDIDRIGEN